ncbi:MAG: fucose isomerase [Actinobacteria bacterium]|nr:fucose isomerase [Actinomycetota bacterium]
MDKIKTALMTFSDPRYEENPGAREKFIEDSHNKLKGIILSKGFEVIDPHTEVKRKNSYNFGFDGMDEVKNAAQYINNKKADVLILECYHWSEPQLANLAAKYTNIPTIVFAKNEPQWAGSIYFGAVCASLLEVPVNNFAKFHSRVFDDYGLLFRYINACGVYSSLKKSAIILFGGSYSLNMPLLRDDYEYLKSFLIEEIYEEEQYLIIKKAIEIMKQNPGRIVKFYNWLKDNHTTIIFDNKMVNEEILKTQIAFYLATKDIILEYYPSNVIGISLKCQLTLSEQFGVTGCTIPTFIPFDNDCEGVKKIISETCEGDVKGLITCCILNLLTGGKIPALFGDLKLIDKDYIILSNCGGSSLYYSANSNDPKVALENLTIAPQCQGKSGGAFGYKGKSFINDFVTVARLVREDRKYTMHLFKGETINVTDSMVNRIGFGNTWPHIAVKTNKSMQEFATNVASNHYCLIHGDFIFEIKKICELLQINMLEL